MKLLLKRVKEMLRARDIVLEASNFFRIKPQIIKFETVLILDRGLENFRAVTNIRTGAEYWERFYLFETGLTTKVGFENQGLS